MTATDLNGITDRFSIFDPSLESLHPDDFKGLTAIPRLLIADTALESLPAGIFSGSAKRHRFVSPSQQDHDG